MSAKIEALARELDGRQVDGQILRVTGVHPDEGAAWVQATLEPAAQDVVLHVHPGATTADVLATLASWLHAPIERSRIIEVVAKP
jgi:hypothetical protein